MNIFQGEKMDIAKNRALGSPKSSILSNIEQRRTKAGGSPYDRGSKIPVIRSSICTGEQVTDFKDPISGKFEELMLLWDDQDLQEFLHQYHVGESEIGREW